MKTEHFSTSSTRRRFRSGGGWSQPVATGANRYRDHLRLLIKPRLGFPGVLQAVEAFKARNSMAAMITYSAGWDYELFLSPKHEVSPFGFSGDGYRSFWRFVARHAEQ